MSRTIATTMTMAVVLCLAAAASALASPIDVIRDCSEDGSLGRHYSQNDLSGALRQLPSDLDEYTDCRSVIRAAQLAGAGKPAASAKKSVAGLVNSASPPSASEQKQLAQATGSGGTIKVGGKPIEPGSSAGPLNTAGFGTDVPASVVVVLAILALAMLAGTGFAARRRWPAAARRAGGALGRPLRRFRDGIRRGISRRR
jgi:hypothetical protein